MDLANFNAQPIIKWVGGKRTLLAEIVPRIHKSKFTGRYYEPFIGGGAVCFALNPGKSSISDVNGSLIHFYSVVRDDTSVLKLLSKDANNYANMTEDERAEYFYKVRKRFNKRNFDRRHAADFYILNKIGFNGLYRENANGELNTPFGHRKSIPIPNQENWLAVQKILKNSNLAEKSFVNAITHARKGDFVYFDPPYVPISPTAAFTSYSSDGFGRREQELLASVCHDLTKKGVNFLLSNSDTAITHEIFGDFQFTKISAQRLVSAKASGRKNVSELLISNYKQI